MSTTDKPNLPDLRVSYDQGELDEHSAPADPVELFTHWINDALAHNLPEPNAMSLATNGLDGTPTVRTVLLKGIDERGFHFYTNYESRKGKEIAVDLIDAMIAAGDDQVSDAEVAAHLALVPGWALVNGSIEKTFRFANYYETISFVNAVAFIANAQDHHPDLSVHYNRCVVRFNTHDVQGISETDFECARQIDALVT